MPFYKKLDAAALPLKLRSRISFLFLPRCAAWMLALRDQVEGDLADEAVAKEVLQRMVSLTQATLRTNLYLEDRYALRYSDWGGGRGGAGGARGGGGEGRGGRGEKRRRCGVRTFTRLLKFSGVSRVIFFSSSS